MPGPVELLPQDDTGGQPFIFVSYARKNSDLVYPEIKRLQAEGYPLWCDRWDIPPGRAWFDEIGRAIKASSCFLVFVTQPAVESDNVRYEMEEALKLGRPFIAVYLEMIEVPGLQDRIDKIQALLRYVLHRSEYEVQLRRALGEFVGAPVPILTPVGASRSGVPPRVVAFILAVLAAAFLCLALAAVVTPFLGGQNPNDPLDSRLSGLLVGWFFSVIAVGLGGTAFAVRRLYPGRRHG